MFAFVVIVEFVLNLILQIVFGFLSLKVLARSKNLSMVRKIVTWKVTFFCSLYDDDINNVPCWLLM